MKTAIISDISEIIPQKCWRRDVASNIAAPATLLSPYHLIWRIVHGFLWVHVYEIHNASEGRQKAQLDPQWGHLERGKKRCQKDLHSLSMLINKRITRDRNLLTILLSTLFCKTTPLVFQ